MKSVDLEKKIQILEKRLLEKRDAEGRTPRSSRAATPAFTGAQRHESQQDGSFNEQGLSQTYSNNSRGSKSHKSSGGSSSTSSQSNSMPYIAPYVEDSTSPSVGEWTPKPPLSRTATMFPIDIENLKPSAASRPISRSSMKGSRAKEQEASRHSSPETDGDSGNSSDRTVTFNPTVRVKRHKDPAESDAKSYVTGLREERTSSQGTRRRPSSGRGSYARQDNASNEEAPVSDSPFLKCSTAYETSNQKTPQVSQFASFAQRHQRAAVTPLSESSEMFSSTPKAHNNPYYASNFDTSFNSSAANEFSYSSFAAAEQQWYEDQGVRSQSMPTTPDSRYASEYAGDQ